VFEFVEAGQTYAEMEKDEKVRCSADLLSYWLADGGRTGYRTGEKRSRN
jgi:hypothetical protein